METLHSRGRGRQFGAVLLACLAALVAACSDSNSNSQRAADAGYLQFYNASPNSSVTDFVITTTTSETNTSLVSKAEYGDASAITAVTPADYALSIERADPANPGEKIALFERDVTVIKDEHSFWLMTGDYSAPELTEYRYVPPTPYNSGEFGITVFNVTEARGQIELYYVAEGGTFDEAQFLVTLGDGGRSEPSTLSEGNYIFFAVDVDSGNRILTTDVVPFVKANTYFLMLRELGYGDASTVVLDQVSGSSFVYSYQDQLNPAPTKIRAYNSITDLNNVDVILTGASETHTISGLAASTLSDVQSLAGGEYDVELTAAANPDVVHYQREEGRKLASGSNSILFFLENVLATGNDVVLLDFLLSQPLRPRLYESHVNYVHLGVKQVEVETSSGETVLVADPLILHFVNEDAGEVFEAVDGEGNLVVAPTSKYNLTNLEFGSQRNFSMPVANYVLYLTYSTTASVTNEDGTVTVVSTRHQFGDSLDFEVLAGENYLLTFEADASATDGYRLKISQ
ncbi:hypothetical protein QWY82_05805 [Simiduia curdlanivorans]|uniref:DUF4397 domain-containing protein n=1 Tax=Simiduia curdlanivorans TaxID=1492769 RepID=A0ABV8V371_9GAMM|nr:hypothetical protein [Simiduia curdlanivorans]MDN3638326.1 hypothetical protein [Simiduia curdlanivorans]